MSSQYGELRPTNGWDRLASLGHPRKYQQVSYLGMVTATTSLTEINQTLHDVWSSLGLAHYIFIFGAVAPNGSLPGAKFTLHKSLSLSYIGSVTTRIQQSAPPIFSRAAITLGIGHIPVLSRCQMNLNDSNWDVCIMQQDSCVKLHDKPSPLSWEQRPVLAESSQHGGLRHVLAT